MPNNKCPEAIKKGHSQSKVETIDYLRNANYSITNSK